MNTRTQLSSGTYRKMLAQKTRPRGQPRESYSNSPALSPNGTEKHAPVRPPAYKVTTLDWSATWGRGTSARPAPEAVLPSSGQPRPPSSGNCRTAAKPVGWSDALATGCRLAQLISASIHQSSGDVPVWVGHRLVLGGSESERPHPQLSRFRWALE